MKKSVQNTLLPLLALMLVSGIALLIMLYARHNSNLKNIAATAGSQHQFLLKLEQLDQAQHHFFWSARRFVLGEKRQAPISLVQARQRQYLLLENILTDSLAGREYRRQLGRMSMLIRYRNLLIDSAISLGSQGKNKEAVAFWSGPLIEEALENADYQIDQSKSIIYNSLSRQGRRFLQAQQQIEKIRIRTLVLLSLTLVGFFYLLYRTLSSSLVLQKRSAFNLALLEHMQHAVLITNNQNQLFLWNGALTKLLSPTVPEKKQSINSLLPALRAEQRAEMERALQENSSWKCELKQITEKGQLQILQLHVRCLQVSDNLPIGRLWEIQDLTREKMELEQVTRYAEKLELSLNHQVNLLQNIWDKVPEGMFQLDSEGRLLNINEKGTAMIPFASEEMLGKKIITLFPQLQGTQLLQAYQRARDTQTEQKLTHQSLLSDRTYDITFVPLGSTIHVSFKDVSAIRQAQVKVQGLSEALQEARSAERRRISRELHDDLGQQLTGNKVLLSFLSGFVKEKQPELATQFNRLESQLQQTIDTVRQLSRGFHPSQVEDLGLFDVIRQDARDFTRSTKIQLELNNEVEELLLEPKIAVQLYHIFAEALSNITRHAQANRVVVALTLEEEGLLLSITDNGSGFDPAAPAANRSGIAAMKERAANIGGNLKISSEVGRGTTILVTVPLEPAS